VLGMIDATVTGFDSPFLIMNNVSVQGGLTLVDDDCGAYLMMKDSIVSSVLSVTDANAYLIGCSFGLLNLVSGSADISHTAAADMQVVFSGCTVIDGTGSVNISADSLTDTLSVTLSGDMHFDEINVNSVAAAGGLRLYVDDTTPITWAPGTEALTTVVYIKQAAQVGYTPLNPGDWPVVPVQVSEALDSLAAGGVVIPVEFRGVTTIDGSNQSLVSGNNLTPMFSAVDGIFDYVSSACTLTSWFYNFDRLLLPLESLNVRLLVNGAPVVSLGPLDDTSPQSAIVPCAYALVPGDRIFVLINAFGIQGADIVCSYSLYGTLG
jgi:hypothetical protein